MLEAVWPAREACNDRIWPASSYDCFLNWLSSDTRVSICSASCFAFCLSELSSSESV